MFMLQEKHLSGLDESTIDGRSVKKWSGYVDEKGEFTTKFDNKTAGDLASATKNIMGTAITVIRVVGTGVAIIMLTYVAIKYMTAAPSEKADFKKSATAFIVGAIVLFATTQILGIISNFATTNI